MIETARLALGVKIRDAIKLIESDGWYLDRTRGSHRQFEHPTKRGLVTVAGKAGALFISYEENGAERFAIVPLLTITAAMARA